MNETLLSIFEWLERTFGTASLRLKPWFVRYRWFFVCAFVLGLGAAVLQSLFSDDPVERLSGATYVVLYVAALGYILSALLQTGRCGERPRFRWRALSLLSLLVLLVCAALVAILTGYDIAGAAGALVGGIIWLGFLVWGAVNTRRREGLQREPDRG